MRRTRRSNNIQQTCRPSVKQWFVIFRKSSWDYSISLSGPMRFVHQVNLGLAADKPSVHRHCIA